jgi:hypothetical protein
MSHCEKSFPSVLNHVTCPPGLTAIFPVNGGTPETRAIATFTVTSLPVNNNAPNAFGVRLANASRPGASVGGFEVIAFCPADDTDATLVDAALRIGFEIVNNGNGHGATVAGAVVTITDKPGYGAATNTALLEREYVNCADFGTATVFSGGITAVVVNDNLQLDFKMPENAFAYKVECITSSSVVASGIFEAAPNSDVVRTLPLGIVVDPEEQYYARITFLVTATQQCLYPIE